MNQLSVKGKILLLAAIMLAITCLVAAVGIYYNYQAKQSIDDMYNHNLMTTQYLSNANSQLSSLKEDIAYVLTKNYATGDRKLLLDEMSNRVSNIQENVAKVKEIDRSQRAQETIALLEKDLAAFAEQIKASENLQNTQEDRIQLLKNLSEVSVMGERLSQLTPDNVLQGKLLFQENNLIHARTIKIFLGIILAGLLMGIVATTVIAGNIAIPLRESVRQLNAVADGDLTQEIPQKLAERQDDVGIMVQALQRMQESLRQILSEVRQESDQNVAMAEDVHGLVQSLDQSTQDVSCVMEIMVVNMEKTAELTSDVQQQINSLTETMTEQSDASPQKLADSMQKMKQAMGEIADATMEGAVGTSNMAEKMSDVAVMANEILNKVDMSRRGAENLKQQVEKFKV